MALTSASVPMNTRSPDSSEPWVRVARKEANDCAAWRFSGTSGKDEEIEISTLRPSGVR